MCLSCSHQVQAWAKEDSSTAENVACAILCPSEDLQDLDIDVSVLHDDIIEKDALPDLQDLTWRNERETSALYRVQKFGKSHSLVVLSNGRSVQELIKNVLVAIDESDEEEKLLAKLGKACEKG